MAQTGTRVLVILALVAWVCFLVGPAWYEYDQTKVEVAEVEQQLLLQQQTHEALRSDIYRLQTDDRAVERVARDKFGLCRPGEKIYDFSALPE